MSRPVLLFDVNETLLDLGSLRRGFESVFGTSDHLGEWFARLLHGSLVANHLDSFRPFDVIAVEALVTLGRRKGVAVDPLAARAVVDGFLSMPAHPDVPEGLRRLRDVGHRLYAFSNGTAKGLHRQLTSAGLVEVFDGMISVEPVGAFKPAPAVYRHAAEVAGVDTSDCLLVAAHDWDIMGARAVGIDGAFVARPGVVWGLPDPEPDLVVSDLLDLAARMESSADAYG